MVGAELAERLGERVLGGGRSGVDAVPGAVRATQHAVLDADHDVVAVAVAERLAEQELVVAHAVEVAGVEQGDAGVERGVDGGDALGLVGRPVEVGHAHQAEAEGRDAGAGAAEATRWGRVER